MATETVEQLKAELDRYKSQIGNVVKTGVIHTVKPTRKITETMFSVEFILDCSEFISGKHFPNFVTCQVNNFNKTLFAKFDTAEDNSDRAFGVGDQVQVICEVGSRQTSQTKEGATVAFNNIGVLKCVMLKKATETTQDPNTITDSQADDDLPF